MPNTVLAFRAGAKAHAGSARVEPCSIAVPEAALEDLRQRIAKTRWPDKETVADASQGVRLAALQALTQYWGSDYDWRKIEARLNALPNFVTEIDGVDIHFIHVRSRHESALPIIITHGWPGSVIEQLKVIDPLVDPTAHGASAADAFDVVIPSLPGYGFSDKPAAPGWGPPQIALAWTELMQRLGYCRFLAQGGDWGSIVTDQLGMQAPPGLLGIHTNLPSAVPPEIAAALPGRVPPPDLSAEERTAFEGLDRFLAEGLAYAHQMAARPQTLYALSDSPAGLAAWLYEKFDAWTDSGGDAQVVLTRDELLDDISLYWLTNTGVSSARLYWENRIAFFAPTGVTVPTAVSVFAGEFFQAPRSWAERAYPNLIHYNRVDRGGHFAAWEQPEAFVEELRAGFRPLRQTQSDGGRRADEGPSHVRI